MKSVWWLAAAACLLHAETAGFRLESPAFRQDGEISPEYACDGVDVSPPLAWTAPPDGTKSLALIVLGREESPTDRTHWVVYNIPAGSRGLTSQQWPRSRRPDGTRQGINHLGRVGYWGPCPDARHAERIVFTLYALDARMPDKTGYDAGQLAAIMDGHILAKARLAGTYRRRF
jgi:Raf kinase inhibitor-like YbhB/YbcL family protein